MFVVARERIFVSGVPGVGPLLQEAEKIESRQTQVVIQMYTI